MQIILKENVENLGFKDDMVNVKNWLWEKLFNPSR